MSLERVRAALNSVTLAAHHYHAPDNATVPYVVWAEDGDHDFLAENRHMERADQGTIDLYTLQEDDPLLEDIPRALTAGGICWYKNSTQYEEETHLIHVEWVFEV